MEGLWLEGHHGAFGTAETITTNVKVKNSACCEIFSLNKIEYDNPILNHPTILKALTIALQVGTSEIIDRFSGFDKLFVEQACVAGNIEILYDSVH